MNRIGVFLWMVGVLSMIPAVAQTEAESMTQAVADFDATMERIAEFVRGVEFDEGDIETLLEYWTELDSLAVMSVDEDEDSTPSFARDVREILADPEYQAWARGHGLDPEDWLRKSMRINTVMMTEYMAEQREMMATQRESYARMVEESCAQVDQETCQQMRDAMVQSLAMGEAMMKAADRLPPGTDEEIALLGRYGEELKALMMSDDEYGDYDSGYAEDYDDDYEEDDG
jgi:hypothetical protein